MSTSFRCEWKFRFPTQPPLIFWDGVQKGHHYWVGGIVQPPSPPLSGDHLGYEGEMSFVIVPDIASTDAV